MSAFAFREFGATFFKRPVTRVQRLDQDRLPDTYTRESLGNIACNDEPAGRIETVCVMNNGANLVVGQVADR